MAPSLSPNNEWIVFTSNRDKVDGQPENWELYVAPTSGGDPTALQRVTFNENAIDTDPMWGPNNWVVFESNRRGNWDLFAIDMSTGREYQLTDSPADDINPFWSPDGQKLVFQSSRSGRWQVYELNLVSNAVRLLSDGVSIDVEPVYSNDGTRIAYRTYEVEDGRSRIAIMDTDGKNRTFVTEIDENATNHTWSPSDSLIAYQSDLDGDLDIYIYEVGTGETRKLTDNTIDDYAPTWRCDDNIVIFTSDIAGNPDIYEEEARPIQSPAVRVEEDADQLTFEMSNDIYPQMTPPEENASREGRTSMGDFGEQTVFLEPLIDTVRPDLSIDGILREDWQEIEGCPE
jgi:Tol biopolymer transport system component